MTQINTLMKHVPHDVISLTMAQQEQQHNNNDDGEEVEVENSKTTIAY